MGSLGLGCLSFADVGSIQWPFKLLVLLVERLALWVRRSGLNVLFFCSFVFLDVRPFQKPLYKGRT